MRRRNKKMIELMNLKKRVIEDIKTAFNERRKVLVLETEIVDLFGHAKFLKDDHLLFSPKKSIKSFGTR